MDHLHSLSLYAHFVLSFPLICHHLQEWRGSVGAAELLMWAGMWSLLPGCTFLRIRVCWWNGLCESVCKMKGNRKSSAVGRNDDMNLFTLVLFVKPVLKWMHTNSSVGSGLDLCCTLEKQIILLTSWKDTNFYSRIYVGCCLSKLLQQKNKQKKN